MPRFETEILLPRPVEEVFAFFCRPANLVALAPAGWHLQLVEAPEQLELGSRITIKTRRWGISQRITGEVTIFEPNVRFVEEQRKGPFRKWQHQHHFEAVPAGTRIADRIAFEPPGGALGLLMTSRRIEEELQQMFAYRQEMLKEMFGNQP